MLIYFYEKSQYITQEIKYNLPIFKMSNYNLIIVITIFALVFATSSFPVIAVRCNKADRAALLAFKDSFPDKSFYHSYPDWVANSTNDCCSWDYVRCDSTGRVTSFVLSGNSFDPPDMDLNGTIPAVLGDLTALKTIDFNYMPGLVGPIPPQMVKLTKLETLIISDCKITGSVPSFLSQLTSLQQLDLSHNMLIGTIPPSLADLANLSSLSLHDNQLSGTIPANLFSKLAKPTTVFLYLSNNNLKGAIPESFANVDFSNIYLDSNKFSGDLSLLFGRNKTVNSISMSSMVVFSYNDLCGKIPSGGHFGSFDAVYFEHNKCLCGAPLRPCQ